MRVDRRVAQARGDQLLELLGEHVLEHLGLGVHAIPGHPELLGEEQLEQPVMAQHLQRDPATLVGQPHAVIGLMLDDPDLGELAHHPRHRAGRHPEPRGEIVRRYRRAATSLERIHAPSRSPAPTPKPIVQPTITTDYGMPNNSCQGVETAVCRPARRVSRGPGPRRAAVRQRNAR